MKIITCFLFVTALLLSACQSNQTEVLSRSQADGDTALLYLPLLTVQTVEKTADGCTAVLTDENGINFQAVISKANLGEAYPTLKNGDKLKIVGDYTDSEPVQITATRVILIR